MEDPGSSEISKIDVFTELLSWYGNFLDKKWTNMITESLQRLSEPAYKEIKPHAPGVQYRRETMGPIGITATMSIGNAKF